MAFDDNTPNVGQQGQDAQQPVPKLENPGVTEQQVGEQLAAPNQYGVTAAPSAYADIRAAASVQQNRNYYSERSAPFIIGTDQNKSLLGDARTSDKLTYLNIQRAIRQRQKYLAYDNAFRQIADADPSAPGASIGLAAAKLGPEPVFEDQARVLTSLGNTEDEIQTNLYYEQERTDEQADFYFNQIKPDLQKLQDKGVNLGTLTRSEIADLIKASGGLKDDADYKRFVDDTWNTPGATRLGVSAFSKFKKRLITMNDSYARGEQLDATFMSGRFAWDPNDNGQREAFKDWASYRSFKEHDAALGFSRAFGAIFTMHMDLVSGIVKGTVNPDQYISDEWMADPVKKKEVMTALGDVVDISPMAQQVLGIADDRTETEKLFGAEKRNPELLADSDLISDEVRSNPKSAAALKKIQELQEKGAFKGSRFKVISSVIDGFFQGTANLAWLLPSGGGLNPEGGYNAIMTNMLNLFNIGSKDWEESKLTTRMKWANLSRDMSHMQADWLANGMVFNGPAYYSKTGGGAGGQAIDPFVTLGAISTLGKTMRYGATAAARVAHATETASRIAEIAKTGYTIAELDKAAGTESYLGKVVKSVQEEAAKNGESITETEAVQRALSGKVSVNGIPMTNAELDTLAGEVERWTNGISSTMAEIDTLVAEARKSIPDGINMTNEQIMEYLSNNALPQGAGKGFYDVYDSLDARSKSWFIAKMKEQGKNGEVMLEQLRKISPNKGAMFGLGRAISITSRVGAVGGSAALMWSQYGSVGLGAAAVGAAIGWRYWVPDALMGIGFFGDKIALMDEYYKASTSGNTLYGSSWLYVYKQKMKESAAAMAEATKLEAFPIEADVWRRKAADAAEMASAAKTMHAWAGNGSVPTSAFSSIGEMAVSGTIQDLAMTFVNEDMHGMGYGGVLGNAVWGKAYNSIWKKGILKNNDQLFAKQMIELREIYAKKTDAQKGALIRVLDRVQKEGTVKETVSGLVRAHAQGIDVSLMNEHQASAVVHAFNEGITGDDGRVDAGKMIDYMMRYGLTESEAGQYVSTLQANQERRGVLQQSVNSLRTAGDDLTAKANTKAQALIARTEKLNAAGEAMKISRDALAQTTSEAQSVQTEFNKARESGTLTPELETRFNDSRKKLAAAQRDFDTKTGILKRTKEIVDTEMSAIGELRRQSAENHAKATEIQSRINPKEHYIGETVMGSDGSIGRMINGGVFIFDRPNGKRHIILNEDTFTRADALEEMFHAVENDAVIQELRPQAVKMFFGRFGKDPKTGEVVQLEPGAFSKEDADKFLSIYAQGLPTPELAAGFMHRYEIAYKHYQQTGDPSFLYSQVSEIMARQFVGREISLGNYAYRGAGTPSFPVAGLEGSPTTAGALSGPAGLGKAFYKLFCGDASLRDYVDAGFTNAAEAYGFLGKGGLIDNAFNRQKLDYLRRAGAQISVDPSGTWSAGYIFDENGNRIKDPIFDSYVDKFNNLLRASTGELANAKKPSLDEVYNMPPEQQVAWATAHNRKHWIGTDGKMKPIAQIAAEYNAANDAVFTEFEKRAQRGEMGVSLSVDDSGTKRITLSPRSANADSITAVIDSSDIPVALKRQAISIIAGIAGGDVMNPNAEHPGMLPGYSIVYNPVTSKGLPDPVQRQTRQFMPYSISIERSKRDVKGEKTESYQTNLYFNTIDLNEMNLRPDALWKGELVDEDGIPFYTQAQVKQMFPRGRPDIMRYFQLYLSNLSGAVSPELVEAARSRGRYEPPARSWELFDPSNGSDGESVQRAKIIADMMYRMLGTRPTKKMRGLVAGSQKDAKKAAKLEANAEDLSDDPMERLTAQDVDQPGVFRKIRLDRVESVVNLKTAFSNDNAAFPFSSQAYELSQIAHGVKQSWEKVNDWEIETRLDYQNRPQIGSTWFAKVPGGFGKKYSDKIAEGYRHPSGYFVFKTNTSKNWFVADLNSGEIVSQGIKSATDGFEVAANYAMQTVQKPQNQLEVQMKEAGFFPRGLADKANGFRSIYQSKDGLVLERKGSTSSKRFEMRDKFGNVVSSNILMAVNADILDTGQLDAAARIGRTNGQIIIGLQKKLPGMPGNFPMFYDLTDSPSGAQMKGIVGAKNPKFQQIRSVLLETLGPKNAEMVLNTMVNELGFETVHSDQKAVFDWTENFFTKRVNEDMRSRLRKNFPQDNPDLPDWSRATGIALFTLEEANLYSANNPKKPNRAVLLQRADPIRLKVYEQRVEAEQAAASQASELAAQIKKKDAEAQARLDEFLKNANNRDKALKKAQKTQAQEDFAEAEALSKRNEFLKLLDQQDEKTKSELVDRLQGLLEQEGSADWKDQDTIYQEAVKAVRSIKKETRSKAEASTAKFSREQEAARLEEQQALSASEKEIAARYTADSKERSKKFQKQEADARKEELLAEAETRQQIADYYKGLADKQKAEFERKALLEQRKQEKQAAAQSSLWNEVRRKNRPLGAVIEEAQQLEGVREAGAANRKAAEADAAEQARLLMKDGVMSQLIDEAGKSTVDFDSAMASVGSSLSSLREQLKDAPSSSALDLSSTNRTVIGQNLNKALHSLRELEKATVSRVIGNELGWKIAEVTIAETQPKTGASRAGQALLASIMQRGIPIDLTPALTDANISGQRKPAFGWSPDAGTGKQIVQLAAGSAMNLTHDISRLLRRKYVVYNPSNAVVGVYETQEQAAEAAAKEYVTSKKK